MENSEWWKGKVFKLLSLRRIATLHIRCYDLDFAKSQLNRDVGLVVDDIDICEEGLGFECRAGQIGHSIATAAVFLQSCPAQVLSSGDYATRSTP